MEKYLYALLISIKAFDSIWHNGIYYKLEFCKLILKLHRRTPNNACRAELGQFLLIINMQKRSLKIKL